VNDDVTDQPERSTWDLWARRVGTVAVAVVAAYASYQHQLGFALAGGAALTTARLWPLSVDGLLILSTAGLLRGGHQTTARARYAMRAAFAIGIVVSLAANIATAPAMTWAPILVAGWPPVALLLAVELLGNRGRRDTADQSERDNETRVESAESPEKVIALVDSRLSRTMAEQVMWDHYERRVKAGLPPPTGAELDQIARTNNYGRVVLRKWRRKGRTDPPLMTVGRRQTR
jgi:hypothetical protein